MTKKLKPVTPGEILLEEFLKPMGPKPAKITPWITAVDQPTKLFDEHLSR